MSHRFYYMSDIHLEFATLDLNVSGENLILAGDITTLRCLNPVMTDAGNRSTRKSTMRFFGQALRNFDRVFYLTGNHESYNFDINLEKDYIADYLPGVIHLDNSSYDIDDNTVIIGGTLWTDMNNNNPLAKVHVGNGMNDFRLIHNGDKIWTPDDAYNKHVSTRNFLSGALRDNHSKNVVVATHHSPSYRGVNPHHGGNTLDAGYCSHMDDFIMSHPQIVAWVFGHTHRQTLFDIGSTKVYSNARGYKGYEASADSFTADKWFEV